MCEIKKGIFYAGKSQNHFRSAVIVVATTVVTVVVVAVVAVVV